LRGAAYRASRAIDIKRRDKRFIYGLFRIRRGPEIGVARAFWNSTRSFTEANRENYFRFITFS
jgi:hypothetical protein